MPQDAFTLKYLCADLSQLLSGGKINRIVQTNENEIVFTIYTGKKTEKLIINVNPSNARIGIVDVEDSQELAITPNFCVSLRKHLLSATLDSISLVGFDRIIKIDFTVTQEFSSPTKKSLYVELMGRYSNLFLTQDGKLLAGNRGVNVAGDFLRPLFVGKPYIFPPTQDKFEPSDNGLIQKLMEYSENDGAFYEFLCANVQGISQDTAKEVVYLFTKKEKEFLLNPQKHAQEFFKFFNDFLFEQTPNPCLLKVDSGVKDFFLFPYESKSGEYIFCEKLYLAEKTYFQNKTKQNKYKTLFERLNSCINNAYKKANKKLQAICSREKDAQSLLENQLFGELITANIYKIKKGDKKVVLNNYYTGEDVEILLDENLSPSQNANLYYKRYNKQKRALVSLQPQKELIKSEADYLSSLKEQLSLCETIDDLELLEEEVLDYGLIKRAHQVKKKTVKNPFRIYEYNGAEIRVGRNNFENELLLDQSDKQFVWLHAKDYHSAHVIIRQKAEQVSEETIKVSAEICAYYSAGREGGKCEIAYTKRAHVKKPKKSKPGFVHYTDYKSVTVVANKHAELLKSD